MSETSPKFVSIHQGDLAEVLFSKTYPEIKGYALDVDLVTDRESPATLNSVGRQLMLYMHRNDLAQGIVSPKSNDAERMLALNEDIKNKVPSWPQDQAPPVRDTGEGITQATFESVSNAFSMTLEHLGYIGLNVNPENAKAFHIGLVIDVY